MYSGAFGEATALFAPATSKPVLKKTGAGAGLSSKITPGSSRDQQQKEVWNNSNHITGGDILKNGAESCAFHNLHFHRKSDKTQRKENKSTKARNKVLKDKETLLYYSDLDAYILEQHAAYLDEQKRKILTWHKTKTCKGGCSTYCFPEKVRGDRYYTKMQTRAIRSIKLKDYKHAVKQELEYNANRYTLAEAWERAPHDLNRYLTGIFAELGKRIPFLVTVELHESAYPHFHIIFFGVTRIADWRKLQTRWSVGFQNTKQVTPKHGLDYAVKYITKSGSNKTSNRARAYLWYFAKRSYHSSRGLMTPINEISKARQTEEEKYTLTGILYINTNYTNGFKEWVVAFGDMILSNELCTGGGGG